MKLIEDLGIELVRKWKTHFGIFECPFCLTHFKANFNDIKRKRKKSCGCKIVRQTLPSEINGAKIIKELDIANGRRMALFQCKYCYNTFEHGITDVKIGRKAPHCGCYKKPLKEKPKKERKISEIKRLIIKHGNEKEIINLKYTWMSMKRRCYSKTHPKYKHYGARGIIICDKWLNSFESFVNDMGSKPSSKHSIDRINNDGNYEPSNCRWATHKEQQNNKRNNISRHT